MPNRKSAPGPPSALAELRDRGAVDALIAAVKDSNVDVRKQALMALAEIRDESALTAITAALKDEDASVRRAAAMAIGGAERRRRHMTERIPTRILIRIHIRARTRIRIRIPIQTRTRGRAEPTDHAALLSRPVRAADDGSLRRRRAL